MTTPKPNRKVAAIALPSLARLRACWDHAATVTHAANRVTFILYRLVEYHPAPVFEAIGLYRREGQVTCAAKHYDETLVKLCRLYPELAVAQVA